MKINKIQKPSKWQIATIVLAIMLITVTFTVFYKPDNSSVVFGNDSLGLTVSPSGSIFKLGVNESQTFTTQALNGTAPFSYTWILSASGNYTLSVNGDEKHVSNASVLKVAGQNLTLSYPQATEVFVNITVSVTDSNGLTGSIYQPIIVVDPYTSPDYILDVSTATVNYIVTADGKGWFQVINGTDGSVVDGWTSTNATNVINNCTSTEGASVVLADGLYPACVVISADNVILSGQSWNAIIQTPVDASGIACGIQNNFTTGNFNDTIQNLQIDGNSANIQTPGSQRGIMLEQAHNCIVQNCYIHDTVSDAAGAWYNSTNCIFQDNEIADWGLNNGIFIEGSFNHLTTMYSSNCKVLSNNIYSSTVGYAINVADAVNNVVSGNTVNNVAYGIAVNSTGTAVFANSISSCSGDGMDIQGSYASISGNSINGTTAHGIDVVGSNNVVQGNALTQAGLGNAYAIYTGVDATDCLITGNIISNGANGGIELFGARTSVTNNKIVNCINNGIFIASASNLVEGNTVKDCWSMIEIAGVNYNIITGNTIFGGDYCQIDPGSIGTIWSNNNYDVTDPINIKLINSGTNTTISFNNGYNPVGEIADPFLGNGKSILDSGGNNATLTSNWVYTNLGSTKTIYLGGGIVTAIKQNGITLYTTATTCTLILQPGDTFSVTFSSAPTTFKVFGQ